MEKQKKCREGSAFVFGLFVGAFVLFFVVVFFGHGFQISTPITELEIGRVYEVQAVVIEGENCLLLLRAEDNPSDAIYYYRLPSNEIPSGLKPGDGLVELFSGLERRPNAFG